MIIETERLILRNWNKKDIDELVEGLNDYNVAKFLTIPYPYTKKDACWFVKNRKKHNANNYYFAITLKDNKKVIGGTNISLKDGKYKGGLWLNSKYAGKGYGTEVWQARAKFAFETLGLSELENGFYFDNEISWKMQKKLGYKIVGESRLFCPARNEEVKEIVTKLTKEDFYNA